MHCSYKRIGNRSNKAQAAIDSFSWRVGDALSALLVFFGTKFAFETQKFAIVNAALILAWLAVAIAIVRHRQQTTASLFLTSRLCLMAYRMMHPVKPQGGRACIAPLFTLTFLHQVCACL